MADSPKLLGHGVLGAIATLYTVPAATATIVASITRVNTSGVAVTSNLYVRRGVVDYRIDAMDRAFAAGDDHQYKTVLCLETGDIIRGDATGNVDYTISGAEFS